MAKAKKRKKGPTRPSSGPPEINGDVYNREVELLTAITDSHRYAEPGDPVGANSISKLMLSGFCDVSKWPAQDNLVSDPVEYYESLREKLISRYVESLVSGSDGPFIPMSELRKLPMVSLLKAYGSPQPPLFPGNLEILMDTRLRKKFSRYGWTIFVPFLSEFVLRMAAQRYVHVKVQAIDPVGKTFTAQLVTYLGTRYHYVVQSRTVLEFGLESESGGPTNLQDSTVTSRCVAADTYEKIMADNVEKAGFTEPEKAFWYDMFGLGPFEETMIAFVSQMDPDDGTFGEPKPVVVHRSSHVDAIRRCKYFRIAEIVPHDRAADHFETNLVRPDTWAMLSAFFAINSDLLGNDGGAAGAKALREITKSHGGKYETKHCVFTSDRPLFARLPKEANA